jgi:hypothetical protein
MLILEQEEYSVKHNTHIYIIIISLSLNINNISNDN